MWLVRIVVPCDEPGCASSRAQLTVVGSDGTYRVRSGFRSFEVIRAWTPSGCVGDGIDMSRPTGTPGWNVGVSRRWLAAAIAALAAGGRPARPTGGRVVGSTVADLPTMEDGSGPD